MTKRVTAIGVGSISCLTSLVVQEAWRYIGGYSGRGTSDIFW